MAHFWPIFGAKKNFLKNLVLSRTTSYGFLTPCQNLEKVNDTIQRKHPHRRTEGRKDDEQTLFYRTLPATAGGPIMKPSPVKALLLNDQCSHHIETSQLICRANKLTGFYMMGTLIVKG